jgi:hypothetical protein
MNEQLAVTHKPGTFLTLPDQAPWRCTHCLLWWVAGMTCCVAEHGPGGCCHYGCTEVPAPPGNIGDPDHFTGYAIRTLAGDVRILRLLAGIEVEGTERAGLFAAKIESLEARRGFLERHQPGRDGTCTGCAAAWPCSGICDLSSWVEYPG